MKQLEYPLYAEGYINRFITTGVCTEVQKFKKEVLSGRVNEWLKKGFAIHENPCRGEFIRKRETELPPYMDISAFTLGQTLEIFSQEKVLKLYVPFGNIGMEESGFYYRPTYLRSYSYTNIIAPEKEKAVFTLTTCGGMTVWVNDELITDYIPFTRNMVKCTTVEIPLEKGVNKFVVCLDDLAERDTDYYFRIRYMGSQALTMAVTLPEDADEQEIRELEKILTDISFEKEAYIGDSVNLNITNHTQNSYELHMTIAPGEFIEKMQNQEVLIEHRQYLLEPGDKQVELLSADELLPAYYYFTAAFDTRYVRLARKIGTQIVSKEYLTCHEPDIRVRKHHALTVVAENDVDNVYKAAALLALGGSRESAEQYILNEIKGVNERKDCSDFHFTMILYIYHTFHEKLSAHTLEVIEDAMTGYRYWIDEPGDDVMWFFSENHALLFHICQYLAGKYLPERTFTNSGMAGSEVCKKGERLLLEWFDEFFKDFITEWNSNAYIPVDVLGIATLYNLTEDHPTLHVCAKRALDMICFALAVNQHKGVLMASFGRTYEKELKGSYNAGTTSLLYVLYNAGYLNRAANGFLPVVLGDYEPPEEYAKYLNLTGKQELIHQNTQGFEQHVNLYLYKNKDVLLSTAVGFKPYRNGYQEHIVQACVDGAAQVFINHPGEAHPYGSGRPNFWAGNGKLPMAAQYRNVSIIKYDIPEDDRVGYTHAYVPLSEFKKYQGNHESMVLEKDGGYIGVRAQNGFVMQKEGPCSFREFVSPGRKNVWVLKVSGADTVDFDTFLAEMEKMEISVSDSGAVTVSDGGDTYVLTKDDCLLVNGEAVHHYPLDVTGQIDFKEE